MLSAIVPDPSGYGRVLRDRWNRVKRIVEHSDATEAELAMTEVNSGVYAFDAAKLRSALSELTTANAQGEEYLPDVIRILVKAGEPVGAALIDDWREIAGVNDRVQLSQARALLRDRIVTGFMRDGVTIFDPLTTWVDVGVVLEPDCVVLPNTMLVGSTSVASGAVVGPNCVLRNTSVGAGAVVRDATCDGAVIGASAMVGPYTYLRPGTRLGRGAKAGGFVEMKNAVVGDGLEGAAPVVRRRRNDRCALEHRCRDGLRELRRRGQARDRRRRRRAHRQRHDAGRAGRRSATGLTRRPAR